MSNLLAEAIESDDGDHAAKMIQASRETTSSARKFSGVDTEVGFAEP
jgi:hypothetical protein